MIATITFSMLARVSAISAIASRIAGIDISPSMTRITIASSPADVAGDQADRERRAAVRQQRDAKPTISDTRAP